jgi:hypothetical protein
VFLHSGAIQVSIAAAAATAAVSLVEGLMTVPENEGVAAMEGMLGAEGWE